MIVTLIAAVSADGFISRGQGIPWDLPEDIAHFRRHTQGKHLLVGRTTAVEMRDWFQPHHVPLILSRSMVDVPPYGRLVHSVSEAIVLASASGELVICGGSEVYAAALPFATRLLLTHVQTRLGGGKPFPCFDPADWHATTLLQHLADEHHADAFRIVEYGRKDPPSATTSTLHASFSEPIKPARKL